MQAQVTSSKKQLSSGVSLQREYYKQTAARYEAMHFHDDDHHGLACALIGSLAFYHDLKSVLDVGSGTGRAVPQLSRSLKGTTVIGIEPVEALREVGYSNGISPDQLLSGDATDLEFPDSSFDLV